MGDLGKFLLALGAVMVIVGLLLIFVGKVPWLGRLPGDIYVERGNWRFYFPLGTSIVLSVVLSVLLWLWRQR